MAQDEVATARHPFHLHEFIRAMLVDLNDNHSHLVSPNTAADVTDGSHPVNASVELIADRIGRVRVGAFSDTVEHSDEYVLMSFMDRPNTRVFGSPTFGATTGNDHLTLSDGASMLVAVASATNRSGEPYDPLSPIDPDELSENTDPALTRLLGQPPCQD
jgi:hypothetical protein